MLLKVKGHEVHIARDGLEAIEKAAELRPEIILMDVGMPRLNGYDATRRIRETDYGREMYIVALTGWGQRERRRPLLGSRVLGSHGEAGRFCRARPTVVRHSYERLAEDSAHNVGPFFVLSTTLQPFPSPASPLLPASRLVWPWLFRHRGDGHKA